MAISARHHGCGARRAIAALVCVVLMVMTRAELGAVTPPGTIVTNYAAITLTSTSGTLSVYQSNVAAFEVAVLPPTSTAAQLRIFRVDPEAGDSLTVYPLVFVDASGSTIPTGPASSGGEPLATDMVPRNVHYREAASFRPGEFVLLRISDADQNTDDSTIDTITFHLGNADGRESEFVRMMETSADSGVFAALFLLETGAPRPFNGRIEVQRDSVLDVDYEDDTHSYETTRVAVPIDPFGKIFDSSTGAPLDGIAITLIDETTHAPAEVLGDDGVSRFPSTVVTGQAVRDSGGATYSPGPGKFVFPLARPGRYRYQVAVPESAGFAFPSRASDGAIRSLHGATFSLTAGSRGESFVLESDPLEIDVPLDPASSSLVLTMVARATDAATGDFVTYELELTNRRAIFPFVSLAIDDLLPPGARVEAKSVRIDGIPAPPSVASDGRAINIPIPDLAAGKATKITLVALLAATPAKRVTNTAVATSGTLRSNVATASLVARDEFMSDRAHILGRVARTRDGARSPEGVPNVGIYLETGTMVVSDERGFFHIEGVKPGTHVVQLDATTLPPGATAIPALGSNRSNGGAWSRFVDLAPGSTWNVEFAVAFADAAATANASPPATTPASDAFPKMNQEWLDAEPESQDWVLPRASDSPDMPATRILVKHFPAQRLKASINGEPVNPVNFDGTFTNTKKTMAVSVWGGVNLVEGDNVIEIVATDTFGIERRRERRTIHFASAPVRAEIDPAASTLVADGVTPPVIVVRLFDRDNHRARRGVTGRLVVREPHAAWKADGPANLRLTPGATLEPDAFTIGDDGVARITLQPVATSGRARFTLVLASGETELQAELRADRQDWMLVGIAEGTSAYRTISGNLENALGDGADEGFDEEGRIAFFAKGRVRGGWLLTAAYDSNREKTRPRALHAKIDRDAYYTVYGDQSERLENAASSGKLYVRLERDAVNALFGDFSLDWSAKSFASYVRDLHGAKVEFHGARVRASAFVSDAGLAARRDEIRGNGLSGPYQLGRRDIVPFSDKIVIEERDPLRPGVIIAEKALARNIDYTIDYVGGSLRLSAPLFATTADSRALFIVARYEMQDDTAGVVGGARVEYTPATGVTVGAARIEETHDGRGASLTGVDARASLGSNIAINAEISRSENARGPAQAYSAEARHHSERDDFRAYVREAGVGFGLGQLDAARTGTRQIGEEGNFKFGSRLALRELLFRETSLATGDQRDAGEFRFEYAAGPWTWHAGARAARDTIAGRPGGESLLLAAGAARRLFHDRLELRLDRETSLAGEAGNTDLPERTALNATFKIDDATSILAGHEWTEASGRKTSQTQLGVQANPWDGGKISAGVAQRELSGPATTLVGGLNQTIKASDTLGFEGGFQQSRVVAGAAADPPGSSGTATPRQPFHSVTGFSTLPQGEGTAGFVGVHWKPATVQYSIRGEIGDTAETRRESLVASAEAEAGHNVGVLWSLVAVRQASSSANPTVSIDGRIGVAWRPAQSGTIVLSRIDLKRDSLPGESGEGTSAAMNENWKAIGNFHFNQSFGHALQASVHLGVKYGVSRIDDMRFAGWTTCSGVEVRRGLGPDWDIGVQAGSLSSWRAGVHRTNIGVSVGRALARNFWGSVGFSYGGFRDADFAAARYTSPGVFVRFRVKLDQESLAGLIRAIKED